MICFHSLDISVCLSFNGIRLVKSRKSTWWSEVYWPGPRTTYATIGHPAPGKPGLYPSTRFLLKSRRPSHPIHPSIHPSTREPRPASTTTKPPLAATTRCSLTSNSTRFASSRLRPVTADDSSPHAQRLLPDLLLFLSSSSVSSFSSSPHLF
jgi:hypothetical protein